MDYSPWPLLTTFDAAKKFVTCQKYFVCQVIKWFKPERDEGHSMCMVLNKSDRVLWIFEPLQSQRIQKLNQLYPYCVKQYYENQLSRLGYSWINGDQKDDEKTCYLLCIDFIKEIKKSKTRCAVENFLNTCNFIRLEKK